MSRAERAEMTKQSIIEHAAPILNEKGFAGMSVDDILKSSKVAKGCFYGHFESKEELAYEAIDYMFKKMHERRDELMDKQSTIRGKIFAFMDLNKNALNSFITGGCPMVNLATESDDTNPGIRKKVKNMVEKVFALLTDLLRQGIANGEFSGKLDPEEYITKMFFSVEGANAICRVLNSNKHMAMVIKSMKKELDTYLVVPIEEPVTA